MQTPLEQVQAFLAKRAPVPADELSEFVRAHMRLETYRPRQCFTREGDTDGRLGFVVSGLFRVYYVGPAGAQHVRNFCPEGTPIGAYGTVIAGQPLSVFIEALEASQVLEFPYGALVAQLERSAAWERLGRRIAEEHYISRERREHALLTLDARARLQRFREDFPTLGARLRRSDVASYIGVRPETLSRLFRPARKR